MKFTCNQIEFRSAINNISKCLTRNIHTPIISMIYIEANDNEIIFRSTNLEMIIELQMNAKVDIKGKVLINYENILKIINQIKGEVLNVELVDNKLILVSESNKISLQIQDFEDMPKLPPYSSNVSILNINRSEFIKGVDDVIFAVAQSEIKPEISSLYLYNNENNEIVMVGTDSYRLAEKKIFIKNNIDNTDNQSEIGNSTTDDKFIILIPKKSISIILSIFNNIKTEEVEIYKYSDGIILSTNNLNIAIKTINGNYPDYRQLFPKEFKFRISFNKAELSEVLNMTTVFKDNYSYSNFKIIDNKIIVKTQNQLIGSYEGEVNCKIEMFDKDVSTEDLEVNYNSNYLIEGLSRIQSNLIHIDYTAINRAGFVSSGSDNTYKYLIMPLNR